MEKLSLGSDSPPKAEIRRDVVDAPAPLVSERERGMEAKGEGKQTDGGGERWASLHYHVTILLTSYLQLLAWKQSSSHRLLLCVLQ